MLQPISRRPSEAAAWLLIGAMIAVCIGASLGLGFRFAMPEAAIPVIGVAILCAAKRIGRTRRRPALRIGATAFLQMTLFTLIGVVLPYALAARGGALWDARFGAIDRALGFDWPMVFAAADRYPRLLWLGGLAYHSLTVQMIACIVVLSATGQADRLTVAVMAAIASGFVTILISGVTPALGNVFDPGDYRHLWPSVAWMEQDMLTGLRDGRWRIIDLTRLMGIVTFPSYHATLPIILAWALGRTRRWRGIAPLWAGITIVATPLFGGHYAIDVIAGAGLAVLALWLTPKIASVSTPSSPDASDPAGSGSFPTAVRSHDTAPVADKIPTGADNALV